MRTLVIFIAIFVSAIVARADWASISTEDLLKKTDFVVVARLTEVREFTKDEVDYGSGVLVVSEVLRGDLKVEQRLKIEWSNPSKVLCPRVEHRQHAGQRFIWLLQRSRSGGVTANYPGRVIQLDERARLNALLK